MCCDMGSQIKKNTSTSLEYSLPEISHAIVTDVVSISWYSKMDRLAIIRKGIPYAAIETISKRLNSPIKNILNIIGMPQTTYNKRKSEMQVLDRRNSEILVILTELIDYGIEVFNQEEVKFFNWLKKPNVSLASQAPESLLDTVTGIEEVKNCLHRIEYGNMS